MTNAEAKAMLDGMAKLIGQASMMCKRLADMHRERAKDPNFQVVSMAYVDINSLRNKTLEFSAEQLDMIADQILKFWNEDVRDAISDPHNRFLPRADHNINTTGE